MPTPNITSGQIAIDPINGIFYYINNTNTLVASSLNLLQSSNTTISTEDGLSISGNLVVSGNVVTVNSETLTIEDSTLELGTVSSPSNTTADGGGIILKGSTDKTILWSNSSQSWESSESINLVSRKIIKNK